MSKDTVLYKDEVWTITDIGRDHSLMVDNHGGDDGWIIDYPIIYDDGRVAFDNPHVIPERIREKIRLLLREKVGFKE